MQVDINWQGNVHFTATNASGHEVAMDGPPASGGEDKGSRPLELILMGLGGCTAFDVVDILRKGRQDVVDLRVSLVAKRADAIPAVFEEIDIHFVVVGRAVDAGKVQRAIELTAQKYCSASIMLEKAGVMITHSFTVEEAG
ncbi:MAG TPA: OsmC family protein [Gammaproteobacteria bacterium]|jgi:putative redox protein|nr:osmotically inducible protein C [Gammaproteobacteria bacterium]HCG70027.1 OsmC family protein [Gammaproteobacteria bacterium]